MIDFIKKELTMRNDLLPFDNPLAKKNKSYKFQEVSDVTFDDLSIYDTESNLPFRHKFRLIISEEF